MNAINNSRTTTNSQPPGLDAGDKAELTALRNLEYDLADLICMARIVDGLVEDAFSCRDIHRDIAGGRDNLYYLTSDDLNCMIFAVGRSLIMANEIYEKFLSIIEGSREAGEEVRQ